MSYISLDNMPETRVTVDVANQNNSHLPTIPVIGDFYDKASGVGSAGLQPCEAFHTLTMLWWKCAMDNAAFWSNPANYLKYDAS